MLGQLERKDAAVALAELARLGERRRDGRFALGGPASERKLQDEQLVEGEALPALLRLLAGAWPVQDGERIAAQRQPPLGLQRCRQRVGPVARERQRRLDELPQLRGRDLLAGWVDRSEVGRGPTAVEVERAHLEAEAVRRAS
jgi:hypothetical protein